MRYKRFIICGGSKISTTVGWYKRFTICGCSKILKIGGGYKKFTIGGDYKGIIKGGGYNSFLIVAGPTKDYDDLFVLPLMWLSFN